MKNTVIALFIIISRSNLTVVHSSTYRPHLTISSTRATYHSTCSPPPQPPLNGIWELDRSQCSGTPEDCVVIHIKKFSIGTHLSVRCFNGFRLNGSADLICNEDGEWTGDIPVCETVYCKDLNSASVDADCQYPGLDYRTCNSSRPGTIATLKCRDGYRTEKKLSLFKSVLCNTAGVWVPPALQCVPVSSVTAYYTSTYRPPLTSSTSADYPRTTYRLTCTAPPQPENGFWELKQAQCPFPEKDCHVGQEFPPGTHLVYSCNSGFKISGGFAHVFCGVDGKWSEGIPVCEDVRCKDLNSASIQADCQYPGSDYVTCNSPRTGTIATLKCRNSYYADRTLPLSTRVTCNDIGQWVPEPLRCIPVCGFVAIRTTPLVVNGTAANIAQFPWHATLYRAVNPNAKKEFICGGSIIQERLVITAAHCVYDENTQRKDDPSKYFVATGNVYRDYDSPFHDSAFVQKTAVKNIYVHLDYFGIYGSYSADIAIVEVTVPFVFSALLQPICMDYYNSIDLGTEMFGRVTGFGRTALGESSYILQTIEVPYVSQTKCREASNTYETQNYVTYDKFCAGYTNGSAVCEGDSGGGLVFKQNSLWYLKGIVSASLGTKVVNGTRQCDSSTYSLYTKVSMHMTWIKCHINLQETSQQFQECRIYLR